MSTSTETETAMNGAVNALNGASYTPESILVTGGAGTIEVYIYIKLLFHYILYVYLIFLCHSLSPLCY